MYSYIYALVREANTAEDIFQEVGVRVVSKGEALPAESDFAAWCRGIARNLVLHHWRSQRRNPVIPNSRLLEALDRAYAEAEGTGEAPQPGLLALVECLRQLSEPARTVVELRYYQGQSAAAIGQRLRAFGGSDTAAAGPRAATAGGMCPSTFSAGWQPWIVIVWRNCWPAGKTRDCLPPIWTRWPNCWSATRKPGRRRCVGFTFSSDIARALRLLHEEAGTKQLRIADRGLRIEEEPAIGNSQSAIRNPQSAMRWLRAWRPRCWCWRYGSSGMAAGRPRRP